MAQPSTILIMGVGNEMRNDDRVGLVLARLLRREAWPGVRIIETGGDATIWLRFWAEAETVVLLDATMTGAQAGALHHCDLGRAPVDAPRSASTHGLGLGHIVELARALDRLPSRLYIVGIEGADFGYGTVLSPAVAAAIPERAACRTRANRSGAAAGARGADSAYSGRSIPHASDHGRRRLIRWNRS